KASWERAYKGHVLWLGKNKLGKVTLVSQGKYSWQAGGRVGSSEDLDKAKADGVDVEALRRDTLRDPAGTLSRTLKAREKNVENNIDPAMKPFLRPDKTGSPGTPEGE
ncbi:MAG: hypothetical protein AAB339_07615, partial [Elusimicrobiota bacterium]